MSRLTTFVAATLILGSLVGCAASVKPGRTVFNDQQRSVLRQANTVKLEVEQWHAPNSVNCDMSKAEMQEFLLGKMRKSGLTITDKDEPFDAVLKFGFGCYPAQLVDNRYVVGLPAAGRSPATVLMVYSIDILHKDLGRIMYSGRWDAPSPHRTNFQSQDFIDTLDDVLLMQLEKKPFPVK